MPQNPYVRRKQKARASKKLAIWREKQDKAAVAAPKAKAASKKKTAAKKSD
jgi:hypothetical protein